MIDDQQEPIRLTKDGEDVPVTHVIYYEDEPDVIKHFGEEMAYSPPLSVRIQRWFGFKPAGMPFDHGRDDEQIFVKTDVLVGWPDRLRILFRGRVDVNMIVYSPTTIEHADTMVQLGTPW